MTLRVLSWNCRRASATHELWHYFAEISPDIAILQEVTGLPPHVLANYEVRAGTPPTRRGGLQRFQSMILVRGAIAEAVALATGLDWADSELNRFGANLLAFRVQVRNLTTLTVVGVYAPAWPVSRDRLANHDVRPIKLTENPDVWVSDLLVGALRNRSIDESEWIVGGDFNACETFDSWKGGPRGNREWLDRMAGLGLVECLRRSQGALTPTFRKPGTPTAGSQIDHLFVTGGLASCLVSCRTGEMERVFGSHLSDHLPIVADFVGIQECAA